MRFKVLSIIIFLSCYVFSQDINSLKKIAESENTAKSWNEVAEYYSDFTDDTTSLKEAVEKAYKIAIEENDPENIGTALYYFAELEYRRDDWNAYFANLQKALFYMKQSDNLFSVILIMNDIGFYYNETGQYDSSIAIYKEIIDLCKKNNFEDFLGAPYINLTNAFFVQNLIDSANYYARMALNAGIQMKDTAVIIESYSLLGILARNVNDFKSAIKYYERILNFNNLTAEESYAIYTNISALYITWDKPEQALKFSEKALKVSENSKDEKLYAKALIQYGGDLILTNKYINGIDSIKKGLPFLTEGAIQSSYAYLRLALAYNELNEQDSSKYYLQKLELTAENRPERIEEAYYMLKGALSYKDKNYNDAILFFEDYFDRVENSGVIITRKDPKILNQLSESYAKGPRNFEKALHYKNLAYDAQDSIYKQEQKELVNEFYVRYQTAEKELENIQLSNKHAEIKLQRMWLIIGIIIIGILGLIAWMYAGIQRLRKRTERAEMQQRMAEKETEYQQLSAKVEQRQIMSYLSGLEAERSRLSKELHDNISNGLLSLEMLLKTESNFNTKTAGQIENLRLQVRSISHELSPPVFVSVTLPELIEDYVRFQNEIANIRFNFEIDPEDGWEELENSTALEIYRIIQEACGNAIKYSNAKDVIISLKKTSENIFLEISDNGNGMDLNKKNKGIGLKIIRSRVESINGLLEISSEVGKGTDIKVKIVL